YIRVSNLTGEAVSIPAKLSRLIIAPSINEQPRPSSVTVTAGESVSFNVVASGTDLSYRWLKDGMEITNATSSTFTIDLTKVTDAGVYRAKVENSKGSVTSEPVTLTVDEPAPVVVPPTITSHPMPRTVVVG